MVEKRVCVVYDYIWLQDDKENGLFPFIDILAKVFDYNSYNRNFGFVDLEYLEEMQEDNGWTAEEQDQLSSLKLWMISNGVDMITFAGE